MRGEGPLRYPGAKSNLAAYVAEFIETNCLVGIAFCEPFAGSAAVSRHLLSKNLVDHAYLYEIDPGLYSFWKSAFDNTDELIDRVYSTKATLDEFDRQTAVLSDRGESNFRTLDKGFAFLFLNRTSYSGIVGAGPIGGRSQASDYPIDCRYNARALASQIRALSLIGPRVTVSNSDGIAAISEAGPNIFIYADPPYFSNGKKFYRDYFKVFDHYRLRKGLINSRAHWLLSYDYDHKVEYLYRNIPSSIISLYHSARAAGAKKELLVSPLGFNRRVAETVMDLPLVSLA
ncbi:DNA adenine methylase [Brevundimonas mediterranea]|uniref:DNA adenine methylase n=1 Tax=Brevundimonas mediterranea TaxID=74329 RepID=UPI0024835B4F|nr:DNA adenine methylase [Brevundimonas mediterranea]